MNIRQSLYGQFGLTLLELVIVTAVLAVVISYAVPGYQDFQRRAQRSDAISQMLQAASCQERIRSLQGLYDTGQCLPVSDRHYQYDFTPANAGASQVFMLSATPMGGQQADACGVLSLDEIGQRGHQASGAQAARCW